MTDGLDFSFATVVGVALKRLTDHQRDLLFVVSDFGQDCPTDETWRGGSKGRHRTDDSDGDPNGRRLLPIGDVAEMLGWSVAGVRRSVDAITGNEPFLEKHVWNEPDAARDTFYERFAREAPSRDDEGNRWVLTAVARSTQATEEAFGRVRADMTEDAMAISRPLISVMDNFPRNVVRFVSAGPLPVRGTGYLPDGAKFSHRIKHIVMQRDTGA